MSPPVLVLKELNVEPIVELTSETIADLLRNNFGLILAEYRKNWHSLIAAELEQFQREFELILKDDSIESHEWADIESFMAKQKQWCDSAEQAFHDYRAENFWEISDKYFVNVYHNLPESIEIPIDIDDWLKSADDSQFIDLWKYCHRVRQDWRNFGFKLKNKARGILKRAPLEPSSLGVRSVYPGKLVARYVQWAFNRKLLDEWLAFQLETGKFINDLYRSVDEALDLFIARKSKFSALAATSEDTLPTSQDILTAVNERIAAFTEKFTSDSDAQSEELAHPLKELELKWKYCGTSALSPSKYNEEAVNKESAKVPDDLAKANAKWDVQFSGVLGNWRRKLQWGKLTVKTLIHGGELLAQSRSGIEEELLPEFAQNSDLVSSCIVKINEWKDFNRSQAIMAFRRENRLLIKRLAHERLLLLTDSVMQTKLSQHLMNYLSHIKAETDVIPEKQPLLISRSLDQSIPNPKIDSIPARELIEIYGLEALQKIHGDLVASAESNHRSTLRAISMMDQIIDFQFETAITLIQQKRDDDVVEQARQLLIEGLERLVSQFQDLNKENQDFISSTGDAITEMTVGFINSIQMLEDAERVFELNLKLTRAKTKSHYRSMRLKLLKKSESLAVNFWKLLKNIFFQIVLSYRRLRKYTGIEESQTRVEDDIQLLLTETYSPLDKLPLVYQRLFKIDALKETRFFYPRQNEFAALEYEFFNWQDSLSAPVVLVGEKGSGKSTLLNYTRNKIYNDLKVYEFAPTVMLNDQNQLLSFLSETLGMSGLSSLDELEEKITEELEPCVCLFENLQKLFLRKVGGFSTLQRMLLLMSRTSKRIHWVVSCSLYSWEFLDKAIKCSKYFHRIIQLEGLSVAEIETIIMQRHRTSGFEVVFDPSPAMAKSSRYKKLPTDKARQEFSGDLFFKDLQAIAQGNIVVAMLFWITAIKEIRKDKLVLNTVLTWDQAPFLKLPPEELFTLAAIVVHDGLTVEQHAKVFYQDFAKSMAITTRLKNNGLLVENESVFTIQPMLYRPVVQTLKNKNILH